MAEERNTRLTTTAPGGTATTRAAETADDTITTDDDATKEELQRRMEEARESISQTVSDIKETVNTQYQNVRENINEALDWREQFRKRPVAFSAGALGVGLLVGYSVGGAFKGDREDDYGEYYDTEADTYDYSGDDDNYTPTMAARSMRRPQNLGATSDYAKSSATTSYYNTAEASDDLESSGPGMMERFKGTPAYDKLTSELGTLGSRFVDEISHTAQTVVLPLLFSKVKDLVGIDLGTQKKVAERSRVEQQTSTAHKEAVNANTQQTQAHNENQEQNKQS